MGKLFKKSTKKSTASPGRPSETPTTSLKSPSKALGARFKHKRDKTSKTTASGTKASPGGSYEALKSRFKHKKKQPAKDTVSTTNAAPTPPKLVSRRENRASSFKMGRTIGEKRERLETKSERTAARKKDKKRQFFRVFLTVVGFAALIGIILMIFFVSFGGGEPEAVVLEDEAITLLEPSVPIVDADSSAGSHITSRMKNYIAVAERDFRDLGFTPVQVVVPVGAIREVDFYLEGRPGYIKMTIDRDSAVSVEDVDRLYRYLESIGVTSVEYIDVRIDGKAYYKPTPDATTAQDNATE